MGHSASEMDSRVDPRLAEIKKWQKAGYVSVNLDSVFGRNNLQCPKCGSIVQNWKLHDYWHEGLNN